MLWTIARHEIAGLRRDGRLRAAAWLGLGLLVALSLLGWQSYRRELKERAHFEAVARQQWEDQGPKQPHRAAGFGFYVTKPELPLALFDSGIKAATGKVLWLEAHERSSFTHSPVEDAGATALLGLTNGAEAIQLLGALLVVLMAYGSVAREREEGTLRLLLAQGVAPWRWFLGKCLGLAGALALLGLPVAVGVMALCLSAAPADNSTDILVRLVGLGAGHSVYFAIWLAVSVAVSARSRQARSALAALLALWVAGGIIAPRAASALATSLAPVPSITEFATAQSADFAKGFDGEPGWDLRLAALEKEVLTRYQVKSLAELPVGFSGLRMQAMDDWGNRISDRHQLKLEAIYTRQTRWQLAAAVLGPFVPMRAFSGALAGMDWPHYQHFSEAGEQYRRRVVRALDKKLEEALTGEAWEITFDKELWSTVPAFHYLTPPVGWAVREAALPLSLLLGWLTVGVFTAWSVSRKLSPL